jgi:hypothetical protein
VPAQRPPDQRSAQLAEGSQQSHRRGEVQGRARRSVTAAEAKPDLAGEQERRQVGEGRAAAVRAEPGEEAAQPSDAEALAELARVGDLAFRLRGGATTREMWFAAG